VHHRVAAVAFVVDHDEMAAGPRLVDAPRRIEWAADIGTRPDAVV